MEIFPWRFILRDFSIEVLEIFIEDLFIGDFSFWRFVRGDFSFWRIVRGDFSLKIYSGDWTFEKFLMKICSWRFFHEDLFLEIFPLKFWKFLLKICSLGIFPLEYGFGDFSFEKWRIVLLKMEIFFMITKWRRWRWTRNDEDLLMMIFFFLNLSFEWEQLWLEVNVDCWISPWLNSCKRIISISNGFIHWNELEVLTQCP